jgi:prefoldin subunit 5
LQPVGSLQILGQEIEALKKKVKEMEEEDEKLRKMQDELESSQDVGGK